MGETVFDLLVRVLAKKLLDLLSSLSDQLLLGLRSMDNTLNVICIITHEPQWGPQSELCGVLSLDLTFFPKVCLVFELAS